MRCKLTSDLSIDSSIDSGRQIVSYIADKISDDGYVITRTVSGSDGTFRVELPVSLIEFAFFVKGTEAVLDNLFDPVSGLRRHVVPTGRSFAAGVWRDFDYDLDLGT